MVKKKSDKNSNWFFEELMRAGDRLGKVVGERWYIIEHTPGQRYHDGYDYTWSRDINRIVSPYYSTREEAEKFLEEHEADEGSKLVLKRDELRERVERSWHSASVLN